MTIQKDLQKLGNPSKVPILSNFFKTGKGQYGEGDKFLGITVPDQRKVAKKYKSLGIGEISKLISSKIHEYRLTALLILVEQYEKGSESEKKRIYDFYWKNASRVNNWDLVDLTAPKIVGDYLMDKPRGVLYKLAKSRNIWEKRIAIIATYTFIRNKEFKDTLKISEILMTDSHDLIHKAVGWMLREVGKQDQKILEGFLKKHYKKMPRTMLRYSIERLSDKRKKFYTRKLKIFGT